MQAWEAREEQLWPSNFTNSPPDSPKNPNPKKNKQTPANGVVNETLSGPHSALVYLQQYHSDRANWKFSKNKETWLQKHILSLDHIPSSYDSALRSYISGLQSQATKSRVRAVAEEAVKQDQEDQPQNQNGEEKSETQEAEMGDTALRQKYYDAALARYKKQLEDSIDLADEEEEQEQEKLDEKMRRRLAKRKRAEAILRDVESSGRSETESPAPNGVKKLKMENGRPPVTKKRKNRTSVVEISSSDEDGDTSSNDSESDSSSDKTSESALGTESNSNNSSSEAESDSDSSDSSDSDSSSSKSDSNAQSTPTASVSRPSSQSWTGDDSTSESSSSEDDDGN
jgi:hypothetical protein